MSAMHDAQTEDWVSLLGRIQFQKNSRICYATKKSPYEVVYGQKPRLGLASCSVIEREQWEGITNEEDIYGALHLDVPEDLNVEEVVPGPSKLPKPPAASLLSKRPPAGSHVIGTSAATSHVSRTSPAESHVNNSPPVASHTCYKSDHCCGEEVQHLFPNSAHICSKTRLPITAWCSEVEMGGGGPCRNCNAITFHDRGEVFDQFDTQLPVDEDDLSIRDDDDVPRCCNLECKGKTHLDFGLQCCVTGNLMHVGCIGFTFHNWQKKFVDMKSYGPCTSCYWKQVHDGVEFVEDTSSSSDEEEECEISGTALCPCGKCGVEPTTKEFQCSACEKYCCKETCLVTRSSSSNGVPTKICNWCDTNLMLRQASRRAQMNTSKGMPLAVIDQLREEHKDDSDDDISNFRRLKKTRYSHTENIRETARANMTKQADRMKAKSKDTNTISVEVGTVVLVPVPQFDRGKADPKFVPGVVVEKTLNNQLRIGVKGGVLDTCLLSNSVRVEDKAVNAYPGLSEILVDWKSANRLSIRAALGIFCVTGTQGKIKCNCNGECSTKRCKCFSMTHKCNSSCHRGSKKCANC